MRRTITSILAACVAAAGIAAAAPAPQAPTAIDVVDHCDEAIDAFRPPAHMVLPLLDEASGTIGLDVRVLLDVAEAPHITALRAEGTAAALQEADDLLASVVEEVRPTFEAARGIYESLGVELSFTWDASSTWDEEPTSTNDLVGHGSEHYGGTVPAGTDVVYTASDNVDGDVAGTAQCIGGGLHAETAFAAGNLYRGRDATAVPGVIAFFPDLATITFAHEVAHLFGAQHQFANCTESVPTHPGPDSALEVCTVMINDNGLAQLSMSTVTAAVTRGYLEELKG